MCLVGHSTGGLDIRRLLLDLAKLKDDEPIVVDGEATVKPRTIRESIRRVVFLSAPHRGTNIADWVQAEWPWRKALIEKLRAAVAGSQYLLVEPIESLIAGGAAALSGAGLLWAVQDSLDEADEHIGDQSPTRKADAHEAASQLALYLRHMASDFHAIDDLTACRPRFGNVLSPAHFNDKDREKELEKLRETNTTFLSYATLGRRAYWFDPGKPAPPLELTKPCTYPKFCECGHWLPQLPVKRLNVFPSACEGKFGVPNRRQAACAGTVPPHLRQPRKKVSTARTECSARI